MVRELDLKKPPSIAESIDWARALLLLGAEDIDPKMFRDTMSIIVKHRTDLDVVAERVGVKLGLPRIASVPPLRASTGGPSSARHVAPRRAVRRHPAGRAARRARRAHRRLRRGAARRGRRRRARPSCSTRSPRSARSRGPSRRTFREALAATLAKSPEDRRDLRPRLRPLLLPRHRAAPPSRRACARPATGGSMDEAGDGAEPRRAAPRRSPQAIRDGDEGAHARPRPAGDRRVRPAGRGLRRASASTSSASAARSACAPSRSRSCRRTTRAARACRATSIRRFEQLLRRELERGQIERTEPLPAGAPAERARPRAAERPARRTSRACTASSRSSSAG